jgi:hypothetical protein
MSMRIASGIPLQRTAASECLTLLRFATEAFIGAALLAACSAVEHVPEGAVWDRTLDHFSEMPLQVGSEGRI